MAKALYGATIKIKLPGEKMEITVPMVEGDTYQTLAAKLVEALRPALPPSPAPTAAPAGPSAT